VATCCIAFGGNLGNTVELFDHAVDKLSDSGVDVIRLSSAIRSAPMGAEAGHEFVNACAVAETQRSPTSLLQILHDVETSLGRQRTTHWGPRTIDLDLLLYNQQVIDTPDIVVPHPAMWYRRFVLEPLAEIAPEMRHPVLDQTIAELFARLKQRPLRIAIDGAQVKTELLDRVESDLHEQFGEDCVQVAHRQGLDPGLFATICLDAGKPPANRSQPAIETDRTLRIFTTEASVEKQLGRLLNDVCVAALG